LSRRALVLYLCVHGAGHAWERLRWLVDLAALLRAPGSADAALADADAAGLGAAMLHALTLAHDWLGLAVDQAHLARARASAPVRGEGGGSGAASVSSPISMRVRPGTRCRGAARFGQSRATRWGRGAIASA